MPEERRSWTELEVEATVADYFSMLAKELRGEPYNKSAHRAALRPLLQGRSDPAIERKHQNISAILIEFGVPYIEGYKPLGNYQELLAQVVRQRLSSAGELMAAVGDVVQRQVDLPFVEDILSVMVAAPSPDQRPQVRQPRQPPYPSRPNYLLRDAMNAALGRAGELFVVSFEQARLEREGHSRLAGQVEHVSVTQGDGLGFDVLSFETDGRERLIEVKTTSFGQFTPFFVSPNELTVSQSRAHQYSLYRLFAFRKSPKLFALPGAIDHSCSLEAAQYVAQVN